MSEWVYPRERVLGRITLVLGLLVWLALIVGTMGAALLGLALGFVLYLFVQSALIAHIKGQGVELSAQQFPDLHDQFLACCDKLGVAQPPRAFVLHGGGAMNAFATQFLGHRFVVLLSGVVEAMESHPDGVRFYIGHELGHLRMKHLTGQLLRLPVLWLPLLGAAYSRARESTCDRHGLACSSSGESAARALGALAAGSQRWQQLDVAAYCRQAAQGAGFWMSLHELLSGYPWLTKRATRLVGAPLPGRHPLAYLLAVFVPYAGRLGAGFGLLLLVYVIGILAAVAIPQYQDYTSKARLSAALRASEPVRAGLLKAYADKGQIPDTLASAGLPETGSDGSRYRLDPEGMVLSVTSPKGDELVFTPRKGADGAISWSCTANPPLRPGQLPSGCTVAQAPAAPR
jgi:Zn-dependent protease with chaperone function/type II secretory pathway pseudopilin PulG